MEGILCVLIFALMIAITVVIARDLESVEYNKGVCPRCGKKLRFFIHCWDIGRGYICDSCNYTAWVKHKRVDNYSK